MAPPPLPAPLPALLPHSPPLALVITGATGFTGRALLRRLALLPAGSVAARALVRGDAGRLPAGVAQPVAGALPSLDDAAAARLFPPEPHVLIHLANHNVGDAAAFEAVNVGGTQRLLAALPASCVGIIYGSSLSVLGQAAQEGVDEAAPASPQTALARSRLAAEQRVLAVAQARGIGAYVLRPRFVLGQGDAATLPGLLRLARRGLALGAGTQRWSVIDVDDYAEIIWRLCLRLAAGASYRGPLHIGYERPVSFDEVRQALGQVFALPQLRQRLPVAPWWTQVMARLPLAGPRRLATQLELVGLSHFSATRRLQAEVGASLIQQDPRDIVLRAAHLLRAEQALP